jgi:hypothetical protein
MLKFAVPVAAVIGDGRAVLITETTSQGSCIKGHVGKAANIARQLADLPTNVRLGAARFLCVGRKHAGLC